MKEYELTVLFHPDLEMNLEPSVKKVTDLIKDQGGEIIKSTDEGKRHLAYTVQGHEYAVFYFFEVNLPATAPAKLSSAFNISDEVIRYLLVHRDPRRAKATEHDTSKDSGTSKDSDSDDGNNDADQPDAKDNKKSPKTSSKKEESTKNSNPAEEEK